MTEIAERSMYTSRWEGKTDDDRYDRYLEGKKDLKRIILKSVDNNREMRSWVKTELNLLTPTSD